MPAFPIDALHVLGATNSDCERVRSAFAEQPVATWSSLAFCGVGVLVAVGGRRAPGRLVRGRSLAFGTLLVLTGIGSFAYHGIGGPTARWLHDATFLLTLGFVALDDWLPGGRWSPGRLTVAVAGAAAVTVVAVDASLTNPTVVVLGLLLTASEARAWPSRTGHQRRVLRSAAATFGVAVAVYVVSRTDGALCDPDSLLQGHALWHVLTAVSLGLWARAAVVDYRVASADATTSAPTTS